MSKSDFSSNCMVVINDKQLEVTIQYRGDLYIIICFAVSNNFATKESQFLF